MTAQRQLFGGGRRGGGGVGGGGGGGQKVSFKDSFGQNQNPYRWVSPDIQQQQHQQQQGRNVATNTQQMTPAEIMRGLATEVETVWEAGNMWPFSCLGFDKDSPSLPGFTDISPEEMRSEAYEALQSGNIQPYVQRVEAAYMELNSQRQDLKNPSMALKQKLISFIDDCKRKKSSESSGHVSLFSDSGTGGGMFGSGSSGGLFGSSSSSNQQSSGLFGQQSTFGQTETQSGFGQTGTQFSFGQGGTQSLFGQTGAQSGSSQTGSQETGFGQTGSLFGQSSFAQGTQPGNAHGQAQTGQASLFGQAAAPFGQGQAQSQPTLFGKPVDNTAFGSQPASGVSGGMFQTSTQGAAGESAFGHSVTAVPSGAGATSAQEKKPVQESETRETTIYTPLNKLRPEELEQFRAPTFSLGFIPTRPPPRELSHRVRH